MCHSKVHQNCHSLSSIFSGEMLQIRYLVIIWKDKNKWTPKGHLEHLYIKYINIYIHTYIYIEKKYPLVYNSSREPQSSSLQMEGDMDSKQPICLNCALYIEFHWRALVCLTCKSAK